MTPEKQRIAIAEACGWRWEENHISGMATWYKPHQEGPTTDEIAYPPDYLNDLNAMHEAENMLTEWQDREYRDALIKSTCCAEHRASAMHRAESFLKTKGLWTE